MTYFHYVVVLMSILLCITQLSISLEFYNQLSGAEVKILFHRKLTDVPEYNTAYARTISRRHRNRRDVNQNFHLVQFEIDGKKYNLKLEQRKRSVFTFTTPVWLITSIQEPNKNYTYKTLKREDTVFDGIFFEDDSIMATLLAHYDENRRQIVYNGIFGLGTDTHIVRSVPEKWQAVLCSAKNYKTSLDECDSDHVSYKIRNREKESRSLFLTSIDPHATDKLEVSDVSVLYIKIVPVIDHELFKLLGENVRETLKYTATFWNAVDTRLAKIDVFQIEIIVTGIVISTDQHSLSFIDDNGNEANTSGINGYRLLEDARMYFYENFINDTGSTNYDAIIVMTALNTKPTAGMSYIGRICNRLYSTAFVQDDANFFGLHSATHELGHLLNLSHDGSEEAKDCEPYGRNGEASIMAPLIVPAKSLVWSECSKNSLSDFVKTKASKCLYESYRAK